MPYQDEVLKQQWIVVSLSIELLEKPKQVTIMGEKIVLFRSDGAVHAFKDMCIHRGASLSLGCIRENKLVCPYHAWEYNNEGQCVKIPQLSPQQTIPAKAKAIVYGCIERYDMIWVNLTAAGRDLPPLPEFDDPSIRTVIWGPQEIIAKPPRVIENFLDVGHLAIVHEGYLGTATHTEIGDYRVHQTTRGIHSDEIAIYQPDPDGTGQAKTVYYTYEIFDPLTVKFTKTDPTNGNAMSMLLTIQPVNDELSIAYGIMGFNYEMNMVDDEINHFQDIIFSQDKPIVENQKPEDLPLDLQTELSLKVDRMSIAYRKYLVELGVTLGTA